jgi:ubiquinone/menaquinone biosynthesis C-methylase UbiE
MLARAPQPRALADATAVPLAEGSVGAVALLYMLYHLSDPRSALREAYRVLRSRGAKRWAQVKAHEVDDYLDKVARR